MWLPLLSRSLYFAAPSLAGPLTTIFAQMKIAHLIFFGFVFILLLFTITTYMNSRQSEKVNENASFLSKSFTVVRQATAFSEILSTCRVV